MRLYSSGVLLLGAIVLQHSELAVANATKFDFDTKLPRPPNVTSAWLFTINDLNAVPETGLGVTFNHNAPFRLHDVRLLQVPVGQPGSPSPVAWFPKETQWGDIKLDVKTNSSDSIEPGKTVLPNTTVNINLVPAAATKVLAERRTDMISERPVSGGPPVFAPAVLYFQLRYYADPRVARRQDASFADNGPPTTITTSHFALTSIAKDDPSFKLIVDWANINVAPIGDPSSSDGEPGDGISSPPKATDSPEPSSTVRPASGTPEPVSSSSSSLDGRLSTAAIAGIAVGAGLGFLLIAGTFAFCLLRRRRRSAEATHVRGYNGGGRSGDIVAEKEAANAAVSESGAHSPYSDDGRPHFQRDVALAGAGAGASAATGTAGLMAAHHQDEQSAGADYAPYSDRPSNVSMADTAVGSASVIGTASSTPMAQPISAAPGPSSATAMESERVPVVARSDTAMSNTYAHLVEDGMTAAEIARLEDEERQLDQAIERARGVTTK
ncbi:hypothetical protein MCOR02_001627 [Pyricularia oryzae]|uniref:Dystroglycan-type cadherin-like domain-containing protein n=1 Tax=Pyricularia oryzae TaxID=318829 RepID=A0A4P7N2A1_PYROR|nr:hypothetical protein MCOR02_001627 [Pyricularia oryzae]KAI6480198.1 hypothetical protein MCOR13_011195 [Pyricularia oryzae]QBZ55582.1 hypothetical protein PoMZ_00482 [Pyricularia oryzae]